MESSDISTSFTDWLDDAWHHVDALKYILMDVVTLEVDQLC